MFYFLITVNFLILFFFKKIEEKFNIYDFPNENKIHLKKPHYLVVQFLL